MIWILIAISSYKGVHVHSVEFTSKEKCERAAKLLNDQSGIALRFNAFCVEK